MNLHHTRKKPLIGITTSLEEERKLVVTRHYSDWILREGGIPIILPYLKEHKQILDYIEVLDGLLLAGGGDIDPTLFGEEPIEQLGSITPERDWLELHLTQAALKRNLPILAICRGCQILNVAAGGTMYQDIASQHSTRPLIQHTQVAPTWHATHSVNIQANTKLHHIVGKTQVKTNSFHHQAVKEIAPNFQASAFTKDGVVEAIESIEHQYVIGVQWHPECMAVTDPLSKSLFQSFVHSMAE